MSAVIFIFMIIGIITVIRFFTPTNHKKSSPVGAYSRNMVIKYNSLFNLFKNEDFNTVVVSLDSSTTVLTSITDLGSTKYIFRESAQLLYVEWHLYIGENLKSSYSYTWLFKTSDNPQLIFRTINDKVIQIMTRELRLLNVEPNEIRLRCDLNSIFNNSIQYLIPHPLATEQSIAKLTALLCTYDSVSRNIFQFGKDYNLSEGKTRDILKECYNAAVITYVGHVPKALKH